MVNVIYNDGIPDGPNNPSVDQPKMKTNNDSARKLIEFDHVGYGNNQGGYHKVIHQETQLSVNTIAGVNQIFSGVPGTLIVNGVVTPFIPNNGGTQLYSLPGNAGPGIDSLSQLTGNSASQNGYQWIGGILLQWGVINGASPGGTVQFSLNPNNVEFPRNLFNVTTSLIFLSPFDPDSTKDYGVFIDKNPITFTKVGFNFRFFVQTNCNSFFWTAIGN